MPQLSIMIDWPISQSPRIVLHASARFLGYCQIDNVKRPPLRVFFHSSLTFLSSSLSYTHSSSPASSSTCLLSLAFSCWLDYWLSARSILLKSKTGPPKQDSSRMEFMEWVSFISPFYYDFTVCCFWRNFSGTIPTKLFSWLQTATALARIA